MRSTRPLPAAPLLSHAPAGVFGCGSLLGPPSSPTRPPSSPTYQRVFMVAVQFLGVNAVVVSSYVVCIWVCVWRSLRLPLHLWKCPLCGLFFWNFGDILAHFQALGNWHLLKDPKKVVYVSFSGPQLFSEVELVLGGRGWGGAGVEGVVRWLGRGVVRVVCVGPGMEKPFSLAKPYIT